MVVAVTTYVASVALLLFLAKMIRLSGKPMDTIPAGTTSGTPQVLLAHQLNQLNLPTVLREYDKVARECVSGQRQAINGLLLLRPSGPDSDRR